MTQTVDTKKRAGTIVRRLRTHFPKPECALVHENAFELLVATILSAQCTDGRVNKVTANLFRKYRKPADYLNVDVEELGRDIYQTGFYRNKAKNIQGACRLMVEEFGGEVPKTIEELLRLPGVARKTANVVRAEIYGLADGITVDTHVKRLSGRLGLTTETDPVKVERDLMVIIPRASWIEIAHLLIWHGRRICTARKPACAICPLNDICPSAVVGKQ